MPDGVLSERPKLMSTPMFRLLLKKLSGLLGKCIFRCRCGHVAAELSYLYLGNTFLSIS